MAVFRTSTDLINEALAKIGVLVAGQAADPEDFSYIATALDSIFWKVAELNICQIPDSNAIPNQWFLDLAAIVAGECATKFGVSNDDYVKLVNAGLGGVQGVDVGFGAAAKSLREMNRGRPTYETLQVSYM